MNKILEMCAELIEARDLDNLVSKVDGRNNYMIRIDMRNGHYKITYAGGFGRGKIFCGEYVSIICKNHTRWFFYTYKKDYKEALQILNNLGIE